MGGHEGDVFGGEGRGVVKVVVGVVACCFDLRGVKVRYR